VVLREDLSGDPPFAELLARTRDVVLEATANQELPFGRLVEALNPVRDPAHNPLVQVMFSSDDAPLPALELAGSAATVFERHNGSAKLDLNVIVEPRAERLVGPGGELADDRITLLWEYNADLFAGATVARMAEHYHRLLDGVLAAPDVPLSRIDLAGPAEADRLLREWSAGGPAAASPAVHDLVADRARLRPDAIAVSSSAGEVTYGELDRRAGAVAAALRRLGVRAETPVGIL